MLHGTVTALREETILLFTVSLIVGKDFGLLMKSKFVEDAM
jgi:hypothetical protein